MPFHLVDLSHVISPDISMFGPSAPKPAIQAWMSHAQAAQSGRYQDCSCEITQVSLLTSCGTYLDSPYHFFPEKEAIHRLDLEQLVLPGLVIDCTATGPRRPVALELLNGIDVWGKAVLFHTGWDRYWKQPEYVEHPFLDEQTAITLRDRGARLVGIDCLVIDDTTNPRRPVHVTLLEAGILIVENLTHLGQLSGKQFRFFSVPVKVEGAAAFPVRAFAEVEI